MKYIIIVCVIFISGIIGYIIKLRFRNQKELLCYIKNYLEFLAVNISVYQNDIPTITNNFIIQQNNKNAKYVKIFQNNNNLYQINTNFIKEYIFDELYILELTSLFKNLGKSDKSNEYEKIKIELSQVDGWINASEKLEKEKGDLYFKICLALGVALSIIIW